MTREPHETVTQGGSVTPERFARVRAIFEAAVSRPAAERRPYVEGACAGDVSIFREVEAMLAAEGKASPLLDSKPRTSSGPEEGRFPAGTILGERYRILGLLGKGGMGEVYRAHDLKLEQQVALKFLPAAMVGNPRLLERFRAEVRIARQVSHRNVCRVYDLGEVDGAPYISMEYVDGEDLGSLLRRIGRLPGDKALEFARRLCAGLAAAHEKGVLHRDLKPANIMIDGRGQVLIMDFGLAAAADAVAAGDIRSGTPAYMAPEQKQGREVTVRSDIYSLGLVLAEMFTGEKASQDGKRGEPLGTTVKELDPAVDKAIERCLDPNPSRRPDSALALARMLPGGDPLAEALAAGETPSPEMVAGSEEIGGLSVRGAVVCLVSIIVGLAVVVALTGRLSLLRLTPLPDPPEVLSRKAQDLLIRFGYTEPLADSESWFETNLAYVNWAFRHLSPQQSRDQLRNGQPAAVNFRYRQSRHALPSSDWQNEGARLWGLPSVPPPTSAGDADLRVDPQGHLVYLHVVPPVPNKGLIGGPPNWALLLEAAGLDPARLIATEPRHVPVTGFDTRSAWTGTYSHALTIPLRIEAASWQGQPVFFQVTGPWSQTDSELPPGQSDRVRMIQALLYYSGLALASFLAWRHSRSGRGDTRAAGRLAAAIFLCNALATLLLMDRAPDSGYLGLDSVAGPALVLAITIWVFYMALEPYVRRRWPQSLISWTRLVNHGPKDPLVAGHLLIGTALGMLFAISVQLGSLFARQHGEIGMGAVALPLQGVAASISTWLYTIGVAYLSLLVLFSVFLLHALTRRTWITALICMLASAFLVASGGLGSSFGMALGAIVGITQVVALLRFGMLPTIIAGFLGVALGNCLLEFSTWYAGPGILLFTLVLALTAWSFYTALAGRKLWKGNFFEG